LFLSPDEAFALLRDFPTIDVGRPEDESARLSVSMSRARP
jgi:hypothetical protein